MAMKLDHLQIYTNDLALSRAFYESVLEPFGYRVIRDHGEIAVGFGDSNYAVLALVHQADDVQTTHFAFRVNRRADVDRFHALALAAGGVDNGAPGLRRHYHENYYAAFVFDTDGHNLEFVCHEPDD